MIRVFFSQRTCCCSLKNPYHRNMLLFFVICFFAKQNFIWLVTHCFFAPEVFLILIFTRGKIGKKSSEKSNKLKLLKVN